LAYCVGVAAGTGDHDGNGHTDIVWHNDDGLVQIWNYGDVANSQIIAGPGGVSTDRHLV
jgi:hypothetical protein